MAKTTTYTYVNFANDVIAMLSGEKVETSTNVMIEKAKALRATNEKKAEYNAKSPKKSTAKGASEKTQGHIKTLSTVFGSEYLTANDINETLGTDFTALQVANAVKFMPNIESGKVVRTVVNAKGLKADKMYTGYRVKTEMAETVTAE